MQGVTVLGSTGTIGVNTLDVLANHTERFWVYALTAYSDTERLLEQCRQCQPQIAVLVDEAAADRFKRLVGDNGLETTVLQGVEGLNQVAAAAEVSVVMAGIVGAAGLMPTLAAVRAGKRVLVANKEPLVMLGRALVTEAARCGAELVPIDSEHNAIFQCMPAPSLGEPANATRWDPTRRLRDLGVRRLLLTGSGGPFRNTDPEQLHDVTPDQACCHPNWVMGRKISVDSATMMNKGLEIIEACWLFGATPDQIQVVIHPQSIIHSMVEYIDGSLLAHLGAADMRIPIAHGLGWPRRLESGVAYLDLSEVGRLDFEPPDPTRFPCLSLAQQSMRVGGTAPAILNAANEEAVRAFLEGDIRFTDIPRVIEETLTGVDADETLDLDVVLQADRAAREVARMAMTKRAATTRVGVVAANQNCQ